MEEKVEKCIAALNNDKLTDEEARGLWHKLLDSTNWLNWSALKRALSALYNHWLTLL